MASIGTFNFDGLASGLDTKSIISKMLSIDRMPMTRLQQDKANTSAKLPLLQQLNSLLLTLKNSSSDLKLQSAYRTMKGTSSNAAVSMSVGAGALASTNILDSVTKLATSTRVSSATPAGKHADPAALLSANGMRTPVTTGTFSLNGTSFTIDGTDTLDSVLAKINGQTGTTGVEASYNPLTDNLVLRNADAGDKDLIALGASGDTSNFLAAANLSGSYQDTSSGRTVVTSGVHLGALDAAKKIGDLNLDVPVASGDFMINGVSIAVDATLDTLGDVVTRINESAAGVTATYSAFTDKLEIVNKATGATAINFAAGTSNFLDAFHLDPPAVVYGDASALISNTATPLSSLNTTVPSVNGTVRVIGRVGSRNITINAGSTITQAVAAINAQTANTGVVASFNPATGKFRFQSNLAGDYAPITVTNNTGNFAALSRVQGVASDTSSGDRTFLESAFQIGLVSTADAVGAANFATPVQFTGGTSGRLSITHDGVTKTFDYNATTPLSSILSAIGGDSELKVTAAYNETTDRFEIKPLGGTGEQVTVKDVEVDGGIGNLAAAAGIATNDDNIQLGQNAQYKLNGITYYSNSNTISDKIAGASFTLGGTSSTATTITIAADSSDAKGRIKTWVANYNAALEQLNGLVSDPSGVYYNDPSMRDILNRLRQSANSYVTAVPGEYKSLGDIGITSGAFGMAWTEGYIGKLELDEGKLSAALAADPEAVNQLFFYDPNGGTEYRSGVGFMFDQIMGPLTEANGMIARNQSQLDRQIDDFTQRISDMESQLKVKEDYYRSIFATLEVNMGQLQRQSQWLSQQLGSMGGFGGSSSKG